MNRYRLLVTMSYALILLAAGTAHAQDGSACQPDFGAIYGILARAQVAFDSGDQTTGVAAVAEARQALAEIEAACGGGGGVPHTAGSPASPASASMFSTIERDDLHARLEDGAYHVDSTTADRRYLELVGVDVGDFTLDVDVTVQPGYVAGAAYGIAFRGPPGFGTNFYVWRISTNAKTNVLAKWGNAERGAMQSYSPTSNANEWLDTPAYQTDMNAVNHLTLQCIGYDCVYLINGQQVMRTTDKRLESGGIALITEGVMNVVFDNVQISAADGTPVSPDPAVSDHGASQVVAEFTGLHACGEWPAYAEFRLDNASEMAFESVSAELVDVAAGQSVYGPTSNNRPFNPAGECPPGAETLAAADTAYVAYNVSSIAPGTEVEARLTICTGQDATGTCVEQTVRFVVETP